MYQSSKAHLKPFKVNLIDFAVGGPTRFPTTPFHFTLIIIRVCSKRFETAHAPWNLLPDLVLVVEIVVGAKTIYSFFFFQTLDKFNKPWSLFRSMDSNVIHKQRVYHRFIFCCAWSSTGIFLNHITHVSPGKTCLPNWK